MWYGISDHYKPNNTCCWPSFVLYYLILSQNPDEVFLFAAHSCSVLTACLPLTGRSPNQEGNDIALPQLTVDSDCEVEITATAIPFHCEGSRKQSALYSLKIYPKNSFKKSIWINEPQRTQLNLRCHVSAISFKLIVADWSPATAWDHSVPTSTRRNDHQWTQIGARSRCNSSDRMWTPRCPLAPSPHVTPNPRTTCLRKSIESQRVRECTQNLRAEILHNSRFMFSIQSKRLRPCVSTLALQIPVRLSNGRSPAVPIENRCWVWTAASGVWATREWTTSTPPTLLVKWPKVDSNAVHIRLRRGVSDAGKVFCAACWLGGLTKNSHPLASSSSAKPWGLLQLPFAN